jgi:hypothetical protein
VSIAGACRPDGQVTAGSDPFASAKADRNPADRIRPWVGSAGSPLKSPMTICASVAAAPSSHASRAAAWTSRSIAAPVTGWRCVTTMSTDPVPGRSTTALIADRSRPRSMRATSRAAKGSRSSRLLPYSGRPAHPRIAS